MDKRAATRYPDTLNWPEPGWFRVDGLTPGHHEILVLGPPTIRASSGAFVLGDERFIEILVDDSSLRPPGTWDCRLQTATDSDSEVAFVDAFVARTDSTMDVSIRRYGHSQYVAGEFRHRDGAIVWQSLGGAYAYVRLEKDGSGILLDHSRSGTGLEASVCHRAFPVSEERVDLNQALFAVHHEPLKGKEIPRQERVRGHEFIAIGIVSEELGSGLLADSGDVVEVEYRGTHLYRTIPRKDHRLFEWMPWPSGPSGTLRFRLDEDEIHLAVHQAVRGMRVGGERTIELGAYAAGDLGIPALIRDKFIRRWRYELRLSSVEEVER